MRLARIRFALPNTPGKAVVLGDGSAGPLKQTEERRT
jgi:hypothetical protein